MEEAKWYSIPLIIFSLLLLFFLLKLLTSKQERYKNLPPSPPGLPIIGHLHLLKEPLHQTLQAFSDKYGPIILLRLGPKKVVVVTSPSAVEECFTKNDVVFANRPRSLAGKHLNYNNTNMGAAPYGELWRNLRRITTLEMLSTTCLDKTSSIRGEEVKFLMNQLMKNCGSGGYSKVDLNSKFYELSFNVMTMMMMGKRFYGESVEDIEEAKIFQNLMREHFELVKKADPADLFPVLQCVDLFGTQKKMIANAKNMDKFLQKLVDEHRRISVSTKMKTLIHNLLSLQETEPEFYTNEIIYGIIMELCGKGGNLLLVRAILNLKITPLFRESSSVVAAVSRLKSKILTILLHLCEAESISYLDEIASTPQSMNLAKSVALEVLELLKIMFARDPKQLNACSDKNYPMGLLQLNGMRLADIFSDDSNFRFYITTYFSEVAAEKFHYNEEDESEYEECDSDDSDEDPTFEVVDKIRCRFSRLSTKNKPKSRNIKEMEEDSEEDPDVVVEMVVPELGEEDQKSFEAVQKIIEVGQVEKLKVDQCKVYLRKHGLRLTGNKDILIERIKEHLEGGGEKKYPISSFVLNCKGDACTGDVVMFEQNVYEMFNIASRSASGPPCGKRIVAGRIVKESYGAAKQQHTFTIEVLWSEGEKPLPPLYPLLIKGRNLYRLKTMRQRWENEGERQKMISEKHARGSLARSNREARIQLKDMKKANNSVPIVNVPSQRIQQWCQNHEPIMKSIPSHCQFQRQSHEQYTNGNNPLRRPLTNMNCSIQSKDPYPFGSCPGSMSPLRSHNHERSMISYPLRNPIQRQGPERSVNPNSSRHAHAHKGNMNFSPTEGPFQRQLCRFYAQGRCHYGDRCKYLHEYRGNQKGKRVDASTQKGKTKREGKESYRIEQEAHGAAE